MSGGSVERAEQPVGRLAGELAHFDNIRRVEIRNDKQRALIRLVNSGVGARVTSTIREFGYRISAISIRHGYISVRKESSADDDGGRDEPTRSESADFGGGDSTGVQDL